MESVCGSDKPSQVVNQNKVPAWVDKGGQAMFQAGAQLAQRPYPTATQPRIAEFTPDQLTAFDMTRSSAGEWKPAFDEGMGLARSGSTAVGGEDIARYMNPYDEMVINSVVEQMNRQSQRNKIDRNASLSQRGSYLTQDRRAVIDNLANESDMRAIGESVGGLKRAGYSDALSAAQGDKARQLTGAGTFQSLAQLFPQLRGIDISRLSQQGGMQQQQTQSNLNLAEADRQKQFAYPQEQLNWLRSILSGTPYSTSQITQTPNPSANPWAQILGAVGTGVGAAGAAGAFA